MLRAASLYLSLALLWTAPVWGDPGARVVGRMEGELRDHLWVAWLVRTRVVEDAALPVFFPQARFPIGLSLYPLDPLNHAIMTGLAPVAGVVAAFAVLTTLLLALAGLGGWRLAGALGAGPGAALVAGVLVQAGPPVLGSFADTQTEGMGVGWACLTLAELVAGGGWSARRAARLGIFGAATALSTPYLAHALLLVGVPLVGWSVTRGGMPGRALLLAASIALPVAGLAAAGLWTAEAKPGGQLHSRGEGGGDWPPAIMARDAALPPALVQAQADSPVAVWAWPREARFLPPTTGPRREAGWILPLLALGALRAPRGRWLVAGAAVYAALAYGSAREHAWTALDGARIPLPFDLWYRHFPLGAFSWKPAQYAVPAWILGVAALSTLPPRVLYVGAALVLGELQLRGPTPAPLPAVALAPLPAHQWIASRDEGPVVGKPAVVEFPCRARSRGGVDALPFDVVLGQLTHRHPLGEAFGRGPNRGHQAFVDALAEAVGWEVGEAPTLPEGWRAAQKVGFGYLLVHGALLTDGERARLDAGLAGLAGGVEPFPDGVTVYTIPPLEVR